jgi:hypothetical protein
VPDRYAELTNVARAHDMSTLQGAVVVNGVDDGLVTTDQSPQMADALNAVGVPTHRYTILLHGEGEPGSTVSCILSVRPDSPVRRSSRATAGRAATPRS